MATMARHIQHIMKMKAIAILLTGLLICTAALARDRSPPATQDGLQLVPDTRLGLVYMDPEADLAVYDKLLLIEAQVAFKKNWQRDTKQARPFHVTASDMTRIKADVAGLFREIFTRELESAGFMLVTE